MANTNIIDEVISSGVIDQMKAAQAELQKLEDQFISTAEAAARANAQIAGTKGVKELESATKKLNAENAQLLAYQKNIQAAIRQRADADAKLLLVSRQQTEDIARKKRTLSESNKELKAEVNFQDAATGSIEKARAAIKKLSLERDKLNLLTSDGRKRQDEINLSLDKYNSFITKSVDAQTKQSRNVGNYQGSAKIIVDALEKEKIKLQSLTTGYQSFQTQVNNTRTTVQGFAGNSAETQAKLQQFETQIAQSRTIVEGFQKVVDKPAFLKLASEIGDTVQSTKLLSKELTNLKINGIGDNEAVLALESRLADLTDQIGDSRENIKALASDTRSFDLFAGSVTFAADAFQTFAGAAILAGASEEEAAEATKTLVAIQAVSNGVKGIANELTTKGTAANKVFAFTQGLVATAFDKSAAASSRFIAALGLIGIIATVVGAVVLAIQALNNKLSEAEQRQKSYNEVLEAAGSSIQQAIVDVRSMGRAFEQAKSGVISKEVALKQYNEGIGKTIGQVNTLDQAEKKYAQFAGAYVQFQKQKALANEALTRSGKLQFEIELKRQQQSELGFFETIEAYRNALTLFQKIKQFAGIKDADVIMAELKAQQDAVKDKTKKEVDELQKQLNQVNAIFDTASANADKISKDNKFTNADQVQIDNEAKQKRDEAAKKAIEDAKKLADALRKFRENQQREEAKATIDADNANKQLLSDNLKRIAEDEKKFIGDRLLANTIFYKAQEQLIKDKAEQEEKALIASIAREQNEITGKAPGSAEIEQLTAQRRKEIVQKAEADIAAIKREGIQAQNDIIQQGVQKQLELIEGQSQDQFQSIQNEETEKISLLQSKYDEGLLTKEQYEKELLDIQNGYALKRLKSELETAEKIIAIKKASGQDTSNEEREIQEIKNKIIFSGNKESLASESDLANQRKALYTQLYSELKNLVFGLVDGGFERQKNALEGEKVLIEERKTAELDRINRLNIAESEKADKIKILDANTENQKRIIERRQKQIDIQKAKAQKIQAAFEIGVTIAKNIVEASKYLTNPLTAAAYPAIVALISGIGLAQLAAVLARPIPEYWTGTDDSEGGPVWLGERGKELLITPDNKAYETPGRATLANIPAHSKVINNADYMAMLMSEKAHTLSYKKPNSEKDFIEWQTKATERHTEEIVKAIKSKPEAILNISPYGINAFKKHGQSWTEYIDKQVKFKN